MIKLTYIEIQRLLHEKKIWIIFIALFASLLVVLETYFGYQTQFRTANDAFGFSVMLIYGYLLPLFAGFSTGDLIIKDRRSGVLKLYFTKNVTPFKYILSKTMTNFIGQVIFNTLTLILFFVLLMVILPVGPIDEVNGPSFDMLIAVKQPFLVCFHLLFIYTLAASGLGFLSLLSSVWLNNTFMVCLIPTLVYYLPMYVLPFNKLPNILPYLNLGNSGYDFNNPPPIAPIIKYWVLFNVILWLITVVAFTLKKDHD